MIDPFYGGSLKGQELEAAAATLRNKAHSAVMCAFPHSGAVPDYGQRRMAARLLLAAAVKALPLEDINEFEPAIRALWRSMDSIVYFDAEHKAERVQAIREGLRGLSGYMATLATEADQYGVYGPKGWDWDYVADILSDWAEDVPASQYDNDLEKLQCDERAEA